MIKKPNSRQKRKFKCGFKGEGSHKNFGIGQLTAGYGKAEKEMGSYYTKFNRDPYDINKKWQNVVHAARKWAGKHIGSKPYRTIVNASTLH